MRLKVIVGVLFLVVLLWVGYVGYAAITAQPKLKARWGNVSEERTEIVISGEMNRPLLVPVSLENLTIEFADVPVARVTEFNYSALSTNLGMVLTIDNRNLVRALVNYLNSGQRGNVSVIVRGKLLGVIPINLDLKRAISENLLAYLNFTAESQEFLGGTVESPALVETIFDWAGEENGKAVLVAHMRLYNPNKFPIPVANLSFNAYAKGIKMAYGSTEKGTIIPAEGYATLDVRTYIIESALPKVWELHVKNGEESRIRADIFLDINVLGGVHRVKLTSYEETVKTDIMEQLNEMLNSLK